MKILITCADLSYRAGAQLYVAELLLALKEGNHDARVFTLRGGAVARMISDLGVEVYERNDLEQVRAFQPEIVHAHHAPTLWTIGALAVGSAAVISSLGVLPDLEQPTPVWPGVSLGIAVSEEVKRHIEGYPFGEAVPIQIVRNWYIDGDFRQSRYNEHAGIRRVAVVTNHLSDDVARSLEELQGERRDFSWEHIGLPHNVRNVTYELVGRYDLVITIGRTALLAAAAGVPVLLADTYGSDGLINVEDFDSQQSVNFSGRWRGQKVTVEHLRSVWREVPRTEIVRIQSRVTSEFALSQRLRQFEEIYFAALDSGRRLDLNAARHYGPLARIYLDSLKRGDRLDQTNRHLSEVLGRLEVRAAVRLGRAFRDLRGRKGDKWSD